MCRIELLFTLETLVLEQFLLQSRIALLRCRQWNVLYRIGFSNSPDLVLALLSEQKLQRNLLLVNGVLSKQL